MIVAGLLCTFIAGIFAGLLPISKREMQRYDNRDLISLAMIASVIFVLALILLWDTISSFWVAVTVTATITYVGIFIGWRLKLNIFLNTRR